MKTISRRAALGALSMVPAAAMATWPRLSGITASRQSAAAGGDGASMAGAEFGPTGGHWPSRTPRPSDHFDMTLETGCTWGEISKAIESACAQAPGGNARVLVRPGTLPGYGAGSTKKPVLSIVGRTGRRSRVLVMPRDGIGTVQFSESIRLDRVSGVAFVGFWTYPFSVVFTGGNDMAWACSKGCTFNVSTNETAPISNLELVECVTPESRLSESDAWAVRTGGSAADSISVVGSYIASYHKPASSPAHLDTLQLSGSQPINGVTIKDSVIFGSTNSAFIPTTLAANVLFDHSLVVSGSRLLQRYPVLPGGKALTPANYPQAVNGSGTDGVLSAIDSTFIGSVPGIWASVVRTRTSAAVTKGARSGGFTYDASLATVDAAWLEQRTPTPTDERLRATWKL